MMDFWKSCEMGSQITITICLTIIILVIIAVCSFLFWQCKCCKAKNEKDSGKGSGNDCKDKNSQDNSKGDNGSSPNNKKNREIRQEEEDRAKALIKDLFEATRVKRTDKDLKEEKCDIEVTKQLVTLYEQVLQKMSSNQTTQAVDTAEIVNETEKQVDGSNNQMTDNNESI